MHLTLTVFPFALLSSTEGFTAVDIDAAIGAAWDALDVSDLDIEVAYRESNERMIGHPGYAVTILCGDSDDAEAEQVAETVRRRFGHQLDMALIEQGRSASNACNDARKAAEAAINAAHADHVEAWAEYEVAYLRRGGSPETETAYRAAFQRRWDTHAKLSRLHALQWGASNARKAAEAASESPVLTPYIAARDATIAADAVVFRLERAAREAEVAFVAARAALDDARIVARVARAEANAAYEAEAR